MIRSSQYAHQIRTLRTDAHRPVIHFFEKHEHAIRQLDQGEYLDILLIYLDALFACGEYKAYGDRVDEAILLVLDGRLLTQTESDSYHHLLFRKAASEYHIGNQANTLHILKQLINLAPNHPLAGRFLTRCLVDDKRRSRQFIRAGTILLLFLSVGVIVLDLFWIRPFHPEWVGVVETIRNLLFVSSLCLWLTGEALLRILSWREARSFLASARARRATPNASTPVLWH